MKLQNNGGPVDLNKETFARGEVREFSEEQALDLVRRYPKMSEVKETPAPKVETESVLKKTIKKLRK